MDRASKDFSFAQSCQVHLPFSFRIANLEGSIPKKSFREIKKNPELRHAGSQQQGLSDLYVTVQLYSDGRALTLPFRTKHKSFTSTYTWNEWITLPIKFSDLQANSQLVFTVWDIQGNGEAGPVGGSTFKLFAKKGDLKRGHHRLLLYRDQIADPTHETKTLSDAQSTSEGHDFDDEMGRLEDLVKVYERGDMKHVEWIDKLVFRKIEEVHMNQLKKQKSLFLYIDLPKFDFPVVFAEPEPAPPPSSSRHTEPFLWAIRDPDIDNENLVEVKHRRLVRSHRTGPLDRELKPEKGVRDELNMILHYTPTHKLTSHESDLLWKFRFYLSRDKKALTKFLKSVTWTDAGEVKQAVETLLPMWADVDVEDALELLGPGFSDGRVRAYAVKQISRADDEELLLYLLQLVQALKFDSQASTSTSSDTRPSRSGRASSPTSSHRGQESGLSDFLIKRSVQNPVLGNNFHWYLMVECEDKTVGRMYAKVAYEYMKQLTEIEGGQERRDILRRQGELVSTLSSRSKELRVLKIAREKKIEKLRAFIADPKNNMSTMAPLPLPLNARLTTGGIIPEKTGIFKSNLQPLLLFFEIAQEEEAEPVDPYAVIFKNGDDLRQDQLVVQLFTLMDKLLLKENLDLKLITYSVLATGAQEGMIEFIPSKALATIMRENDSLLAYLRKHHPDESSLSTYGVEPAVLDTFVRSCAGYCVLTYLLGVGDRHLDNLMLSPDGHFFHVDFGYILGRDPKPFPPPVKVSKEMIDALGGTSSPHYNRFKNLSHTAFSNLRKSANLILNLVGLMVESGVQDIRFEPDKAVSKIQDNFMLHLSEEEAIQHFDALLSQTSHLTTLFDAIHDWAQYYRS